MLGIAWAICSVIFLSGPLIANGEAELHVPTCKDQSKCIEFQIDEVKQAGCEGNCQFKVCVNLDWGGECKKNLAETLDFGCFPRDSVQCPNPSTVSNQLDDLVQTDETGIFECKTGAPGQEITFAFKDGTADCVSLDRSFCVYDRKHVADTALGDEELSSTSGIDDSVACRDDCMGEGECNAYAFDAISGGTGTCTLLKLSKSTLSSIPSVALIGSGDNEFGMVVADNGACPGETGTNSPFKAKVPVLPVDDQTAGFIEQDNAQISCSKMSVGQAEDKLICPNDLSDGQGTVPEAPCVWKVRLPEESNCKLFCQVGKPCDPPGGTQSQSCFEYTFDDECNCVGKPDDGKCEDTECYENRECDSNGQCTSGTVAEGKPCGVDNECIEKLCTEDGECKREFANDTLCSTTEQCQTPVCEFPKGCTTEPDTTSDGCVPDPDCEPENGDCVANGDCCPGLGLQCMDMKCKKPPPPPTCAKEDEACSVTADCCNGEGLECSGSLCKKPPPPPTCTKELQLCNTWDPKMKCCDGLWCKYKKSWAGTSEVLDHAADRCVPDTAPPQCSMAGESCGNSAECCPNNDLVCRDSKCKTKPSGGHCRTAYEKCNDGDARCCPDHRCKKGTADYWSALGEDASQTRRCVPRHGVTPPDDNDDHHNCKAEYKRCSKRASPGHKHACCGNLECKWEPAREWKKLLGRDYEYPATRCMRKWRG